MTFVGGPGDATLTWGYSRLHVCFNGWLGVRIALEILCPNFGFMKYKSYVPAFAFEANFLCPNFCFEAKILSPLLY
jgi:hypothetical protein